MIEEIYMTHETKVTIAIPTYNRATLLKISLKSVLAQKYPDFRVIVIDNASSDNTEAVVGSFADSRIAYVRNETNIGLFRNWNRAIELNSSPYLTILQDDDELLPGFIHESVLALDNHPHAAFSVGGIRIDINGTPLLLPEDVLPEGVMAGLEYLHEIVAGRNWPIHPTAVMIRSSALAEVGSFDTPHSKFAIDFNLYFRLAARFEIVFIPKELALVRYHEEQDIQLHIAPGGTAPLAVIAERTDAIAYLLQSVRAEDASYRQWLAQRLLHLSMRRSEMTAELIPTLNLSWAERLQIATEEIATLIPPGESFILVDENQWGCEVLPGFHTFPFLERDGQYWGSPPDDETAVRELERMRQSGASFMVVGWPAFWWFDYYSGLRDYLSKKFRCVRSNSRIMVFDLRH